jgi:hypothetical protein
MSKALDVAWGRGGGRRAAAAPGELRDHFERRRLEAEAAELAAAQAEAARRAHAGDQLDLFVSDTQTEELP